MDQREPEKMRENHPITGPATALTFIFPFQENPRLR